MSSSPSTPRAGAASADARRRRSPALVQRLARRTAPRVLAASARVALPARLHARAARRAGRRGRVELFFAFDDPCSAVAVSELLALLAGRPVDLVLLPVVERGIEHDPALADKRAYAIRDARRLARRRLGLTLAREAPLAPADTAFLAEWVALAPRAAALNEFCRAALARLWFEADVAVDRDELVALWRELLGTRERADAAAVRRCEARMARRGAYDTPAVWAAGRWYFAHDRPAQICEWLDELGWRQR